jgi:hypothetical protein
MRTQFSPRFPIANSMQDRIQPTRVIDRLLEEDYVAISLFALVQF